MFCSTSISTTSYQSRRARSSSTNSSLTPAATSFLLFCLSQAINASLFLLLAPSIFSISLMSSTVMVMSSRTRPTDTTIFLPPSNLTMGTFLALPPVIRFKAAATICTICVMYTRQFDIGFL